MEDEKKKKRNKKKKNKQNNKAAEEVAFDGGEVASEDQNNVNNGQNEPQVSETANIGTDSPNGTECSILAESEKQQWLQREGILKETIRQLQTEKDFHIQKEATFKDIINQLQKENDLHLQKEFTSEEAIKRLRDESNSYVQKEASLEMKITQLQSEKDSWLQKEGWLEDNIRKLVDERNSLHLKEVSLQEKVERLEREKHSWVLKEVSSNEMIANLNDDIAGLRVKVVELEESRNSLLQQNQQLMENISSLQLEIKDLQSTASTRLSELRKVNELFVELDQRGGSSRFPSIITSELISGTAETSCYSYQGSEVNNCMPILGQDLNSTEVVPAKEERNGIHNSDNHLAEVTPEPSISKESCEIVQIPLDENEVGDVELLVAENDEKNVVPISDAPLIGAPFRLVSFVSRYVSGADLVDKNSLKG